MESDFIWSCARKRRFKKKEEAKYWYAIGRKNKAYDDQIHIYSCDYCSGFHIGHQRIEIDPSRKPKVTIVDEIKPDLTVNPVFEIEGVPIDYVKGDYGYVCVQRTNKGEKRFYKLLNLGWEYVKDENVLRKKL